MRHRVLAGASIFALTSMMVKVLSAVYRIPLQNIVGNEGFYSYQQVYPIYGLGMSLALTGVPLYMSKKLAHTQNKTLEVQKVYTLTCFLSISLFIFIFFAAPSMAVLMGNKQLISVIRAIAFVFLFTPFLGILRGVYQGENDLYATAYSQLGEQVTRVALILAIALIGQALHWTCYTISTGAMFAATIAAVVALIILLCYHYRPSLIQASYFRFCKLSWNDVKTFFSECSLISLSLSFMLVLQLLDSFFLPKGLVAHGYLPQESFVLKGIYDRGQPLIQVGLVLITVMISDALPQLTKARHTLSFDNVKRQFIHTGIFIGFGAGMGLCFLLPFINQALFENNEGSMALSLLMLSVIFMSCILIAQTIAQSQGRLTLLWYSLLLAIVVKGISAPWLIAHYQLVGAACSTLLSLCAANGIYIYKERQKLMSDAPFYCKLLKVGLWYSASLYCYRQCCISLVQHRLFALLLTIIGVILNGVIYIYLSRHYQLLSFNEWKSLPLSELIMKVGKIK